MSVQNYKTHIKTRRYNIIMTTNNKNIIIDNDIFDMAEKFVQIKLKQQKANRSYYERNKDYFIQKRKEEKELVNNNPEIKEKRKLMRKLKYQEKKKQIPNYLELQREKMREKIVNNNMIELCSI